MCQEVRNTQAFYQRSLFCSDKWYKDGQSRNLLMAYDSTADSTSVSTHLQPNPGGWYALLKDRWYGDNVSSQASEWGLTNTGGMTSSVSFISQLKWTTFFLAYVQPHSLAYTMELLCTRRQSLLLRSLACLWKDQLLLSALMWTSQTLCIPGTQQSGKSPWFYYCHVRGNKNYRRYKWEQIRYLKCNQKGYKTSLERKTLLLKGRSDPKIFSKHLTSDKVWRFNLDALTLKKLGNWTPKSFWHLKNITLSYCKAASVQLEDKINTSRVT